MDALDRGREAYRKRAWADAHRLLDDADRDAPLGADDLERLANAAYMLGRYDEHARALERAHLARLEAGETTAAAHCAVWLGLTLSMRGELAQGSGWLGRAQRLVERERHDCVERGYLLIPAMREYEVTGRFEDGCRIAADAAEIAQRFGDPDLLALSLHQHGRFLVRLGRVEPGLALLDEAMVAVMAGELSPIVT
ncbi:MAG TPA: hypothetical protein VGF25_03755, partial [Thermoleophilaceae bacterium]